MNKIKVVMHSKTVGYSGTDKTCQFFAKYINKSKFEPFIVYRENDSANLRLENVYSWLGKDHVIPYRWNPGKKGKFPPYLPEDDNLIDILRDIKPNIIHCHYSGYNEWPVFKYLYPEAKWIGHNIFGFKENKQEVDLVVYIADYVRNAAINIGSVNGPVIYNPIEQPVLDMVTTNKQICREYLLNTIKLPQNSILIGRVGRRDNFDPISLKAFKEVEQIYADIYYLVVNPCNDWIDTVKRLNIKNVRFLNTIIQDDELSKFYMGLDIYAHARSDGEMCPTNIQEAMMHNLPIVSHESAIYNGQAEIIGDGGFVVPIGDHVAYRDVLVQLIQNPEMLNEEETSMVRLRDYFGRNARRRAMRYFEAETITNQLERHYDALLGGI